MTLLTIGVIPHPVLHQLMSTCVISARMRTQGKCFVSLCPEVSWQLINSSIGEASVFRFGVSENSHLKNLWKNKQTAEQLEERGNNTAITSQLKQTDLGISQSQQKDCGSVRSSIWQNVCRLFLYLALPTEASIGKALYWGLCRPC